MKWFRSNIRHGSRVALLALAVQFVISFGHFHGIAAQAAPVFKSDAAESAVSSDTATEAARQASPANNDPDQQRSDNCAICAVMALASTALFATPPLLLLPQAIEFLYLTTDAEFVHLNSAHAAFQPRAPPAS
jgi:hypothetical protein